MTPTQELILETQDINIDQARAAHLVELETELRNVREYSRALSILIVYVSSLHIHSQTNPRDPIFTAHVWAIKTLLPLLYEIKDRVVGNPCSTDHDRLGVEYIIDSVGACIGKLELITSYTDPF